MTQLGNNWEKGNEPLRDVTADGKSDTWEVWELKLYFYPSAGGKKKKKEKKSLYASATPELSGCMIFGLLIVRASC